MKRDSILCRVKPLDLTGTRLELIHRKHAFASCPTEVMQNCLIAVSDRVSRFYIDGNEYQFRPGDLMFFRPRQAVAFDTIQIPSNGTTYRAIELTPETAARLVHRLPQLRGTFPAFRVPILSEPSLSSYISDLHEGLLETTDPQKLNEALSNLLLRLSDHPMAIPLDVARPGMLRPHLKRAMDFIHAHFAESFSIEQIADQAGLSASRLAHVFRARIGLSPRAYIIQYRIHRAKAFLCSGELPARVAEMTGFFDQAHLTHHFKLMTALTPGQYASGIKAAS